MSYRKKHIKSKLRRIKPKKSFLKRPLFWIIFLILAVALSAFYFIFFYPGLQVKDVIISGNEKVKTNEIKNLVLNGSSKKIISILNWNIMSDSIFLSNTENIQKQILNEFSIIQNVQVDKAFPQTINVSVHERKPSGVFCPENSQSCFDIDNTGIIFQELQGIPENMVIVRQALANRGVFTGEKVIDGNIMDVISKIEKNLKDNFQIDLTDALVSSPLRLDVKTNENWQIYFDLSPASDVDLQITKLNLLLNGEISPEARKKLQYIDLRFKDRAYYK